MSASMRRNMPILKAVAGAMVLLGLSACEHYMPNSRPERDSTEAITRAQSERLQYSGASHTMAPSQIRIPTGMRNFDDGECRDWRDTCWEAGAGQRSAVDQSKVPALARMSRPADLQSFRGMLPCLDDALNCRGQQSILTLSADHSWHARVAYVGLDGNVGKPSLLRGCWSRAAQDPQRIVLHLANGNLLAELVASSSNVLEVDSSQDTSLRYTLTRQPEADAANAAAASRCPG